MSTAEDSLATALFSEILAVEHLSRGLLKRSLPDGMELSHFVLLNHLAHAKSERTPAQLAQNFHLTRGAMTNTLSKLERVGHVHVSPDWNDARRKLVSISPAGRVARDQALSAILPHLSDLVVALGQDRVKSILPVLRELRARLGDGES